jgi:site-specific recombinase XerD
MGKELLMVKYKKRSDGRYAKQVTVGHKDKKPIKKTVYGKTPLELEKNYRALMLYVDRNIIVDNQGLTLSELVDEWYRIRVSGKVKRNTECGYASVINRIKTIGELKVKDIKRYNIECLISDIQKEGYSNTAKTALAMLNRIFKYAVANEIVYKNPCADLSVKHKINGKRILTESEKKIIETADMNIKDKAFLYLLRYTGVRRGELFALRKSDIDRKNMTIRINKTVVDNNGKPYVQDTPKTEAGDRTVPIFLKLARPLFDYLETIDDYLFLNKNGKIMASNSMKTMFDNMISKYGFGEDLVMHCFRYNFISECYAAGVDVKKVQAWVGHDDVSTTLNIYTKLSKEEIADGDIMNKFYGSQTEVKAKSRKLKTV